MYKTMHTTEIIAAFAKESDDPLKQVVCIVYDAQTLVVTTYGTNKLVKPLATNSRALTDVSKPQHEGKKFIMLHAEMDALFKMIGSGSIHNQFQGKAIYMSLQPCADCLKNLVHFGATHIEWLEDNRHQAEQDIIKPYLGILKTYKKNANGLILSVGPWLIK